MAKLGKQIAALPMRWKKDGTFQILMVTSRDTGRWIMPKGWTMDGKKPWTAAEIEALEEAGALGYICHEVLGTYTYKKNLDDGTALKCAVDVYPMVVERLVANRTGIAHLQVAAQHRGLSASRTMPAPAAPKRQPARTFGFGFR